MKTVKGKKGEKRKTSDTGLNVVEKEWAEVSNPQPYSNIPLHTDISKCTFLQLLSCYGPTNSCMSRWTDRWMNMDSHRVPIPQLKKRGEIKSDPISFTPALPSYIDEYINETAQSFCH